jgi:hypothetical protein
LAPLRAQDTRNRDFPVAQMRLNDGRITAEQVG